MEPLRIFYIPLDERPCNAFYPQMIAQLQPDVRLQVPPLELLSRKKQAADVAGVWQWLEHALAVAFGLDAGASGVASSDAIAIVSLEMWVYGGLLPSRLHQHSTQVLGDRLQRLAQLKQTYPQLRILASNLIMRTPAYSSSEEEPDYYEAWGESIFRWGSLTDKRSRQDLSDEEAAELARIDVSLPKAYLADYRDRRAKNLTINQVAIDLVQSGVIDFLSIPQDDCAPYGFTAQDQQLINQKIVQLRLQQQVHLYPGADEVGCTLLARAYGDWRGRQAITASALAGEPSSQPSPITASPSIYVLYSAVGGDRLIPRYEDRPLGESLKAHILAAGARWATTPESADLVLAVNSAGQVMQEAWDQATKDITYSSYRNLRVFVARIKQLQEQYVPVAVADVAFSNGGETELVQLLDDADCWDGLLAYAGWNTCCNTLGTAIATALLGVRSADAAALAFNKIYHLLEDWAYQSVVRMAMVKDYLPRLGASYYDFNGQTEAVNREMAHRMEQAWQQTLRQSFQTWEISNLSVESPWQRMFEIGLRFELQSPGTQTTGPQRSGSQQSEPQRSGPQKN